MRRKKFPKGKNPLADWVFNFFLKILRDKMIRLYVVKNLRDPENLKKKLSGYVDSPGTAQVIRIFMDSGLPVDEGLKTIVHELGHFVFWSAPETHIMQFEDLMWSNLSATQKRLLTTLLRKKAKLGRQHKD